MKRANTHTPRRHRRLTLYIALSAFLLFACSLVTPQETITIPPPPTTSGGQAAPGSDSGPEATLDTGTEPTAESSPSSPATPAPTGATPTLAATVTLAPTPSPVPVATLDVELDPPLQSVGSGPLPPTTRDLLFIADGALKLWSHESRQVETLLPGGQETSEQPRTSSLTQLRDDITDYAVSDDGRTLVAARLTHNEPLTNTAVHQYQLLWYDLDSRDSRVLAPTVTGLQEFALSPDGRRLAFTAADLRPVSPARDEIQRHFYLLGTGGGEQPVRLAACAPNCFGIAWHPENNLVTWADRESLWLYNLAAREPEVLLQNRSGSPADTIVYSPISWAANGRFLLMWQGAWEGGSRAVLDVPTKAVMLLPDSFVYADPFYVEVTWMQDDRLFVLRPNYTGNGRPTAELWRAQPEQGVLVREEAVELAQANLLPAAPHHLQDGRFAYALIDQENPGASGFYIQTSLNETPERVNSIVPSFSRPNIAWSPDGAGAIAAIEARVVYAPTEGEALYNVRFRLGAWPHAFHWLPPGP